MYLATTGIDNVRRIDTSIVQNGMTSLHIISRPLRTYSGTTVYGLLHRGARKNSRLKIHFPIPMKSQDDSERMSILRLIAMIIIIIIIHHH